MTVTPRTLTRAAAACAVAGAIFVVVQVNHPPTGSFVTQTDEWVLRSVAKSVMAPLALTGLTGLYLRQVRQLRVLGLVGYVLFALGYLLLFATEVTAALVLPALTHSVPGFVNDAVTVPAGGTAVGDIGHLAILFNLMGACYILGGLIFGIALFRAGVLARWAAALLALSTLGTAALVVLPESFNRPLAVPEGVALAALGLSLWRDQRTPPAPDGTAGTATTPLEQIAVR